MKSSGNGTIDPGGRLAEPDVRRMASVLVGAWRRTPPVFEMSSEDLQRITLGLLRLKIGALGWWRVRHSTLRTSPAGIQLRGAYDRNSVQAAFHGRSLACVVMRLRSVGVEPLLMKGAAIARLYAERGLRPFDDLDVCVRPDQYGMAQAVLRDWGSGLTPVDLHSGFPRIYGRSWEELYARSQLATLGGIEVRVLSAEDHLRVLCLHQLKHGAPSPLWLCDVAVALEARPRVFDWDRVLGPNRRQADWMACAIGLAHQLLEVPIDDTPVANRAKRLPAWLAPSVLQQWAHQTAADFHGPFASAPAWRFLIQAPETLRQYWPNPVAASVHLHVPFNGIPRLPIQAVDAGGRLIRFCFRRILGRRAVNLHDDN